MNANLQAGDVLLYRPKGFYGWAIRFHTGIAIGHVEVCIGDGHSIASRDGQGVGIYPVRTSELVYVLRPNVPFDVAGAMAWFDKNGKGQPYGWLDLLQFFGYEVNAKGMVCSPCATYVMRAAGVPVFGSVKAEKIAPKDFLLTNLLRDVTSGDALIAPINVIAT